MKTLFTSLPVLPALAASLKQPRILPDTNPGINNLFAASLIAFTLIVGPGPFASMPAHAYGRLQSLVQQQPQLFMPTRFIAGEPTPLVLKGPANQAVTLEVEIPRLGIIRQSGQLGPNGAVKLTVTVPTDATAQTLEAVETTETVHTSETTTSSTNDVTISQVKTSAVTTDVKTKKSDETSLVGEQAVIRAYLTESGQAFTLMGSNGQPVANSAIPVVEAKSNAKGLRILPDMPGLPAGLLQQLSTASQALEKQTEASAQSENPSATPSAQPSLYDDGVMLGNPFVQRGNNAIGRP
ncbi:MAG: hypothetical protein VKJ06_00740 [Vampirovibrionales bacterium]|nr:hypothetical protein [Vampirovibrionales bacterium]